MTDHTTPEASALRDARDALLSHRSHHTSLCGRRLAWETDCTCGLDRKADAILAAARRGASETIDQLTAEVVRLGKLLAAVRAEAAPVVGVERVARLYPCHVTGEHHPDHHLTSDRACGFQAQEAARAVLGDISTLPRALHPDCYWCHRSVERAKHQTWVDAGPPPRPAPDAAAPDVEKLAAARIHDRLTRNLDWLKEHGATQDEYRAAAFVVYADLDSKPTPAEMEDIRRRGIERGWLAAAPPAEADGGAERCGDRSWDDRYVCRRPAGHTVDGALPEAHDYIFQPRPADGGAEGGWDEADKRFRRSLSEQAREGRRSPR